jgi:hypothetical protein
MVDGGFVYPNINTEDEVGGLDFGWSTLVHADKITWNLDIAGYPNIRNVVWRWWDTP